MNKDLEVLTVLYLSFTPLHFKNIEIISGIPNPRIKTIAVDELMVP